MTKSRTDAAALGLVLGLLAAPAWAGDAMTSPPWGDDVAKITFGEEDKGLLAFNYKGQLRLTTRDIGSGRDGEDATTGFGFRRNRIALRGAWGEKFSFYVQTEFNEDQNIGAVEVAGVNGGADFQVLDARMSFDLHPAFKVNVGKFKYNLSRENLESCEDPLTLDRSLFIRTAFAGTRDTGVAIWGNLWNDRFQYRLDAMEGRPAVGEYTAPSSSPRYSARGHVTLLDPENGYGYKGTYLGQKKVLTVGGAYQFEKDVTWTDTTFRIQPRDYKAWTVDGFFEYPFEKAGTVTLSGAYEKVDLDEAYAGATPDAGSVGVNGEKNGWYAKAGYLLPSAPVQVFGRYEKWRFGSLLGVYDEMVDWYSVGAHYYIWGQNLKLTGEFAAAEFENRADCDYKQFVVELQLFF